jgi:histidine ammonia-lyase
MLQAENLAYVADVAGALSLEALHGTPRAFDARIHAARPHPRQIACAAFIRRLIEGSTFTRSDDPHDVQDAYTLRCMPQVHGAVRDAILYARWVLEIELNSATDNPLIFFDGEDQPTVLSGGNFHGEPLAVSMDYLSLALAELGNISERRLTRLTDESSNQETLPAFLIKHGGLNSGFMLTQYTAAALASENKVLAHPASVDTIPTSAGREDHVSMSMGAALKAARAVALAHRVTAVEVLCACQALDLLAPLTPSAPLARVHARVRDIVPTLGADRVLSGDIEAIAATIAAGAVEHACGMEVK